MAKKKNKVFCIFCGTENNNSDKQCHKCHRTLNPKKHELLDYIWNEIKDEVKGEGIDRILSIIKSVIKHFWYGTMITASVVISASLVIAGATNKQLDNGVAITNQKAQFTELTDYEKLLGCWKGTYNENYSISGEWYYKFISDKEVQYYLREVSHNINNEEFVYERNILMDYFIIDKDIRGQNRRFFGLGLPSPDEINGEDFMWESDDVWLEVPELNMDYAKRNTRISCSLFPNDKGID